MRISLIGFGILLFVGSRLSAAPDIEVRYLPTEVVSRLPLVVSNDKAAGKELYLAYSWAIQVEAIVCDGVRLPIANAGIIVDEEARYVTAFNASTYAYACPAQGRFVYARKLQGEEPFDDVVSINIPPMWTMLEIEYRIRFADGPVSRIYHARFSRLSLEEMQKSHERTAERSKSRSSQP